MQCSLHAVLFLMYNNSSEMVEVTVQRLTLWRLRGRRGGMKSVLALLQVSPQTLVDLLSLHYLHDVKRLQLLQLWSHIQQLKQKDTPPYVSVSGTSLKASCSDCCEAWALRTCGELQTSTFTLQRELQSHWNSSSLHQHHSSSEILPVEDCDELKF